MSPSPASAATSIRPRAGGSGRNRRRSGRPSIRAARDLVPVDAQAAAGPRSGRVTRSCRSGRAPGDRSPPRSSAAWRRPARHAQVAVSAPSGARQRAPQAPRDGAGDGAPLGPAPARRLDRAQQVAGGEIGGVGTAAVAVDLRPARCAGSTIRWLLAQQRRFGAEAARDDDAVGRQPVFCRPGVRRTTPSTRRRPSIGDEVAVAGAAECPAAAATDAAGQRAVMRAARFDHRDRPMPAWRQVRSAEKATSSVPRITGRRKGRVPVEIDQPLQARPSTSRRRAWCRRSAGRRGWSRAPRWPAGRARAVISATPASEVTVRRGAGMQSRDT